MPVMPTDQTAPAELELVREFVNTLDVEDETDALATPAEALSLARGPRRSRTASARSTRRTASRLVEVREALRELLLANNLGESPPAEALDGAQRAVGGGGGGAALRRRRGRPGDPAAAESTRRSRRLLAIVHGSMNDRTWPRLKACPAEDCQLGVLRPLAQPLGHLVRDGEVRQPRQGAALSRGPSRRWASR